MAKNANCQMLWRSMKQEMSVDNIRIEIQNDKKQDK